MNPRRNCAGASGPSGELFRPKNLTTAKPPACASPAGRKSRREAPPAGSSGPGRSTALAAIVLSRSNHGRERLDERWGRRAQFQDTLLCQPREDALAAGREVQDHLAPVAARSFAPQELPAFQPVD